MSSSETAEPGAILDAWRKRGDHRFDPVGFRLIEALAGRAATHGGVARSILDDKVAKRIAAYGEALEAARGADGGSAPRQENGPPHRGPLAQLVDHVARQAPSLGDGTTTSDALAGLASTPELKALSYFRSTWSKLSADRRLTQSLAKVPENAGPLNSHHLVHRSLSLMRDLSPEYLDRFMGYVDALLWLDQATTGSAGAGAENPRGEGHKKSARNKPG